MMAPNQVHQIVREMASASTTQKDLDLVLKTFSEFKDRQRTLTDKYNANLLALDSTFKQLDDNVSSNTSQWQEYKRMESIVSQIEKSAKESGEWNAELDEKLAGIRLSMAAEKLEMDRINQKEARTGSFFLALVLGRVNVRLWKKGELLSFKDEYNRFKKKSAMFFILFPLVQLFFPHRILEIIHQLWLLHYYLALATRENILAVNGSDIKLWWILHHYVSMLICVVTLLWPIGPAYYRFQTLFHAFLVAQGVIMVLQNNYQSARHYVRRSLGKAQDIDIDSSETIQEKPTDLKILIPALGLTYLAELGLSIYSLMEFSESRRVGSAEQWCLLLDGILLMGLAFGNAITTFWVLVQKSKKAKTLLAVRRNSIGITSPRTLASSPSSSSSAAASKDTAKTK